MKKDKTGIMKALGLGFIMSLSVAGCHDAPPPAHEVEFKGEIGLFKGTMTLTWDTIPGEMKAVYTSAVTMMDKLKLEGSVGEDSTIVLTGSNSRNYRMPDNDIKHIEQNDEWKMRMVKDGNGRLMLLGEMSSDGSLNGSVRMVETSGGNQTEEDNSDNEEETETGVESQY